MYRHAVDRSQGGLTEISIWDSGTDNLLNYIADSSRNLRSLKLATCYSITSEGIMEAVVKLPFLEDLEVSYCSFSGESLKVVGRSCPNLKTLKTNCEGYLRPGVESDEDALAIAETMPGLRHLQLFGNRLTNLGLKAILDNCPNLEHLDLRRCFNLELVRDLEKRCSERIKVVKFPNDWISYHPYFSDMDSSEDDYPFVDIVSEDEFYDDPFGNYYDFRF